MTKAALDKYTREIVGFPNRPRGRPADPNAMTVAERKRAQRKRLAEEGRVSRTFDLSAEVVAALDRFVQFKSEDKSAVVERILRDRLMRKR